MRLPLLLLPCLLACSAQREATPLSAQQELRSATQHYADLVLAMDHAGIAALFTRDGEMVADGQPPIQGPAAIQAHLETFKDFYVLAETLTTEEIAVAGKNGHIAGKYHQRVRTPSGSIVEVGGDYTADWVRDRAGTWRLQRMATASKP